MRLHLRKTEASRIPDRRRRKWRIQETQDDQLESSYTSLPAGGRRKPNNNNNNNKKKKKKKVSERGSLVTVVYGCFVLDT